VIDLVRDLAVGVEEHEGGQRIGGPALLGGGDGRIVVAGAVDLDQREPSERARDLGAAEGLELELFARQAPVGVEVEQRRPMESARDP